MRRYILVFVILVPVTVYVLKWLLVFVTFPPTKKNFSINNVSNILQRWEYIESIRRDCGQLCNTSRPGTPGPFFDHIKVPVDCAALFKNDFIDQSHGLAQAPKYIPEKYLKDFTMNGLMNLTKWYFNEQFLEKKAAVPVWKKHTVDKWIELAEKGKLHGTYGISETNALRDGLKHAPAIKNGRVLVIGSANPWVEACVIEAGAAEVVTLEYGEIKSHHNKIRTMTPSMFRKQYLAETLDKFDATVTFSSVEHTGLGRFGDALNPWGDIITVARAWCVTKPGGLLTIGVGYNLEHDMIKFNAGRYYGKKSYPYLTTNWQQHYRGIGYQRVHVFIKSD